MAKNYVSISKHNHFIYRSKSSEHFTVHGSRVDKASDRDIRGRQMAPPRTPEPYWDKNKILEKTQWPVKNEAYTVGIEFRISNMLTLNFDTHIVIFKKKKKKYLIRFM